MAVSVVPIPACSALVCESSWMRALASWARASRARSGSSVSSRPGRNSATATLEATSPAWAPPIPSAITNRGERTSSESSFARRWRPVSVPAYCSTTRSKSVDLEGEFAVADPNAVPGVQRPWGLQQLLVEVGAVGRVEIFDDDRVALLVDAGVARGGEGILEPYLGAVAPAEDEVAVEVVDHARLMAGSSLDDQAGGPPGKVGRAERRGRVHAGRVGVGLHREGLGRLPGGAAEVAPGAAGDPQQEQIEDGDEAELEGHRYRVKAVHPTSNRTSVEPNSSRSPGSSC